MPKLVIDEIEYNTEDLSDEGRGQLTNLQFVEQQIRTFRNQIAVYQTAQNTYLSALRTEIAESGITPIDENIDES
ncbi:DUF6447 family protein [Paracoccaceae bacterium]|nr:DUF6447 family protein [Paracoccaceae bacterium]